MSVLTPNLYLVGTSEFGVSNAPIQISSEEQLISIYGTRGSLVDAYRKIISITTIPNIFLVKCNGRHSNVFANIIHDNKVVFKGVEFKAVYSSDEYDNIKILFTDTFMQIIFNDKVIQYDFKEYNTIQKLFKVINSESELGICPISVTNYTLEQYSSPTKALVSCNRPILITSNGDNGLNQDKKELFTSIKKSLNNIYGLNIDCIIFPECYIDDCEIKDNSCEYNFYELMLKFCSKQVKFNVITKGIIGFRPLRDSVNSTNDIIDNISKCYNGAIYPVNIRSEKNLLSLVTVTFGDIYYDNNRMIDNHYLAYASVICSEPYTKNITNIDYGSNVKINYIINRDLLSALIEHNFVFLRESVLTNNVHIVNANNMSGDIFSCEYVIRSLQICFKTFNNLFNDILGEVVNNNTEQRFKSLVSQTLENVVTNTAVEKSDFSFGTKNDHTVLEILLYFPNFVNPVKYFVSK